jgi:lactobin A/cerein 7B family class IIb bacteriocin
MNEERIKEVFSDEAFVKELLSKETPEEVQAMLEDKDIEVSIAEIVKLRELLEKKAEDPNAELSDEDLEDVSGGCLGVAVIASFVVCFGAPIVDSATGGRW